MRLGPPAERDSVQQHTWHTCKALRHSSGQWPAFWRTPAAPLHGATGVSCPQLFSPLLLRQPIESVCQHLICTPGYRRGPPPPRRRSPLCRCRSGDCLELRCAARGHIMNYLRCVNESFGAYWNRLSGQVWESALLSPQASQGPGKPMRGCLNHMLSHCEPWSGLWPQVPPEEPGTYTTVFTREGGMENTRRARR